MSSVPSLVLTEKIMIIVTFAYWFLIAWLVFPPVKTPPEMMGDPNRVPGTFLFLIGGGITSYIGIEIGFEWSQSLNFVAVFFAWWRLFEMKIDEMEADS